MSLSPSSFRARVAHTADRHGRDPGTIRVVAVSKGHAPAEVQALHTDGQIAFGENYLQEARAKMAALEPLPLEWHFIGHLQSNKASALGQHFSWVHSLTSMTAATRLSKAAVAAQHTLQVLIQINLTGSAGQHGLAPAALAPFLDSLLAAALPGLEYRGLMTLAPRTHPQAAFARLRRLAEETRARHGLARFTELSMGMSDDWEAAVAEGSTLLRIGRALFGPRPA